MLVFHAANIFVLPLMLAAWAADVYLFLAAVRIVCGRLDDPHAKGIARSLTAITECVPLAVSRWCERRGCRPMAAWKAWAITVGGILCIRCLLIMAIVAMP